MSKRQAVELAEFRARLKKDQARSDADWEVWQKEHPLPKIVPKCPLMRMIADRNKEKGIMKDLTWDAYFMGIAEAVSRKSHCLSHQFGAIAVDEDRRIVATGYNGPPRGYPHCTSNNYKPGGTIGIPDQCPRRGKGYKSGEGLEYCPAAHAERNVLINAARHGASLKGCTLYVTSMTPCRECAKEIVNTGIKTVIYGSDSVYPENGISGKEILGQCGVVLLYFKGGESNG